MSLARRTIARPGGLRLDGWEALCISLFALLVGWSVGSLERPEHEYWTRYARKELPFYAEHYGPAKYSTNFEEWLIRDFFRDRRQGFFLDVGSGHHQHSSNTYYLEKHLGWSGIAVDALPEFADAYARHRPRTKFFSYLVSDKAMDSGTVFVSPANTQTTSVNRQHTVDVGYPGTARAVPVTTLNDLLAREGVSRVDFLSMDIELSEPAALAGFDVRRYQPELVCIEADGTTRQRILDYFARHGYVLVGKYLRIDIYNLYFTPLADHRSAARP